MPKSKLVESRERLRSSLGAGQLGVWELDLVTGRGQIDAGFRRICGIATASAEWSFDEFFSMIHPDDRETMAWRHQRNTDTGGPFENTFRIIRPDGEVRWLTGRGEVVHDASGLPVFMTGIAIDETDRKLAEAALRASEERLRLALDAGRIGLFEHDHISDELYWSPNYREILGVGPRESPSLATYIARIPEEERDRVTSAVRQAHDPSGDGTYFVEHRLRRTDGEIRWVSVRSQTRFAGELGRRKPRRTVGAVRDITTEKQAAEALARSNMELESRVSERARELQSVLDAVPDAVVIASSDRKLRTCNASLTKLFGYDAIEIAGMSAAALYQSDEENARIDAAWHHWRREGQRRPVLAQCRRKDGTTFTGLVLGNVIRDEKGGETGRVGLIRDITEEQQRQQALQQAQKMEALGQLTGGVAHDFNNLLTVIVGSLEMLDSNGVDADRKVLIAQAQEAAEFAAQLTKRLLAFARRQSLEPRIVDVNDLVLGMTGLLRRTLGEQIQISTVLENRVWRTRADPGQLENALLNLAINARDAMPDGGSLTIETANREFDDTATETRPDLNPGRYVMLTVTDSGGGMSAEIRRRAIEPFFTTKEPGAGTGLGLSMIFGFAKQSGGHLEIYSEPGHGTTVRLYLPQLEADATVATVVNEPARPASGTGETVLVMEDDERVRRTSVMRLATLGYEVVAAGNGRAALDILSAGRQIDLLFTDLVMPDGMNGRELAEHARRRIPGLKVLFTSGYADAGVVGGDLLDGSTPLIRKPYRIAELAAKVREALSA